MNIVLTGAAGVLGREVAAQLAERGMRPRLTDAVAMDAGGPHEFIRADLRLHSEARAAVDGADVVIHCAAIHPWKQYSDDEYLDCNVKATHHLLKACVETGVPRVVYTSSIAATGYVRDVGELPLTEHVDCRPDDLYGATKAMGETLCEMFSRSHGLHVISLRPPCFVPRDEAEPAYGAALLGLYGHVCDVAQAHVLALGRGDLRCDAFWCTGPSPYTGEDAEALRSDPRSVYCKYFPEARDFILSRPETTQPLGVYYDLSRAQRELGYEPQKGFGDWFEQYGAQGDDPDAEEDPGRR